MSKNLLQLYPAPYQEIPLAGLYLSHQVNQLGTRHRPFVYANFLSSLDGRIALQDKSKGATYIPKHLMTTSDFRLFMELHAQADCLITHGGYLRALSENKLGNILQVGLRPEHRDLAEWRIRQGLRPQPTIVIASASLDFPLHAGLLEHGQDVYIACGDTANPERVKHWREQGYTILFCGKSHMVEGAPLIRQLSKRGYTSIYLIAGPRMLDTMIRDRQLSRLYQTITHQLLGGEDFRSLIPGHALGSEGNLQLNSLYYEADSPVAAGQFFTRFELIPVSCMKTTNTKGPR